MKAAKLHAAIEGDKVKSWPRMHLGGSEVGTSCTREVWYKFRWVRFPEFEPRMLRLFERGHQAEKERFIPVLQLAGCNVIAFDHETGEQFHISALWDHFGGSLDGIVYGVPDLPTVWMLLEFKTHKNSSFNEVQKQGVKQSKPKHYGQMQVYMHGKGLRYALYCAVNKDNDHLYFEIVYYDQAYAEQCMVRAEVAIFSPTPPKRASMLASAFVCKFCDFRMVCHFNQPVNRNCRTCQYIEMQEGGKWKCGLHGHELDKQLTVEGCNDYTVNACFSLDTK